MKKEQMTLLQTEISPNVILKQFGMYENMEVSTGHWASPNQQK